jgi:NSS family neurotransmitter:Na+ symporter
MERWSSNLGFLLASVGAAVGIGNIWRFSAVAVPLMVLELAAGRTLRGTAVAALRAVRPRFAVLGWLVYTIVFSILSYYLVITGWTLAFVVFSVSGSSASFASFTSGYQPVVYFVVAALATGAVVSLGVRRGIERLTTIVMPLAFLLLIALAVYATTLSGFRDGADFLFRPDFDVLTEPSVWSAAVGQAFFSLSVGFGVLLAYAAYIDRETNLVTSSWMIAIADVSVALLAGLVIFPTVFTHGLEPSLGAELAFSTLPEAFDRMTGGELIAVAFFALIFLAALTSAVSMLEANVAAVTEAVGLSRPATAGILTLALIVLGLPAALSYTSLVSWISWMTRWARWDCRWARWSSAWSLPGGDRQICSGRQRPERGGATASCNYRWGC